MRTLLCGMSLCLCSVVAVLAAQPSAAEVERQFTGNWRLVTFESFDENGAARPGPYDRGASCMTVTATWPLS